MLRLLLGHLDDTLVGIERWEAIDAKVVDICVLIGHHLLDPELDQHGLYVGERVLRRQLHHLVGEVLLVQDRDEGCSNEAQRCLVVL